MNKLWHSKENKRKADALQLVNNAYPERLRMDLTEDVLDLYLEVLQPYRADYVERATKIALHDRPFPPTVSDLVSIIKDHQMAEHDWDAFELADTDWEGTMKDALNAWLDEREKK